MAAKKDLTGQKFNKLTVLYEIPKEQRQNKYHYAEWMCECECGRKTCVRSNYLISGHTKSCGCWRGENLRQQRILDITGKRFGKLVALNPIDERGSDGSIMWKCLCDCGNIHYASTNSLRSQAIQSCGCIRSRGEQTINKILFDNNINYTTQFWFDDLKDQKYLYFDFAILNDDKSIKCLIEYQGEQHYKDIPFFVHNYSDPNYIHKHDEMKREYCQKHNIKLIEIPYEHAQDLNYEYLISLINN